MPVEAEHPYYSTKSSISDWKDLYGSSFGTVPPEIRSLGESVGLLTSFEGSGFTDTQHGAVRAQSFQRSPRRFLDQFPLWWSPRLE